MSPASSPRTARALVATFLAFLALVGFWPSPVDKPVERQIADFLHLVHRLGAPAWVDYGFIEASANVALFVPLGILAYLGFPSKRWWQIAGLGMLISGCMELGQFLFLHSHYPSALDVATNTTGCLLGVLLASAVSRRSKHHLRLDGRLHRGGVSGSTGDLLKAPETSPGVGVWAYALGAYFGALAFIAFWPSPVDAPVQGQLASVLNWLHAHGVPRWLNYNVVEASANVALFVPAGFAGKLVFPEAPWWRITAAGALISGCIELGQFLLLPHRFASLTDIATNTAGALLGALLARGLALRAQRRD